MGGGRIQGKIVLRKSVLIFLTVFADGFGPLVGSRGKIVLRKSVLVFLTVFAAGFGLPGNWIWSPGWEGGSDPGEIVLRKSVLIFLTVLADGFGPLGSVHTSYSLNSLKGVI